MTDTRYTLSHEEFLAHLEALGLHIKLSTLKRWAYEGIIERPQRYKRGKGGKKGRAVRWSLRAVEEACAVWAIRNSNIKKALASKLKIAKAKRKAERIYRDPAAATYDLRTPLRSPFKIPESESPPDVLTTLNVDKVKMKLAEDDEMHDLITIWVAATEKARKRWPIQKPAKVVFVWLGIPIRSRIIPDYRPEEHCYYEASDDVSGYELEEVTLVQGEPDEVIFYMDGEDSRTIAVLP